MTNLITLIDKELSKNDTLRKCLAENTLPSLEMLSGLESNEAALDKDSLILALRLNLAIMKSNYHTLTLIDAYLSECEKKETSPVEYVDSLKRIKRFMKKENTLTANTLTENYVKNYKMEPKK